MTAKRGALGLVAPCALGWVWGLLAICVPRATAQTPVPLGAVLTVPVADYGDIDNLNAAVGNRPAVLHHNAAVITLSFGRADQIRLPQRALGRIRSINFASAVSIMNPASADANVVTAAVPTSDQSYMPGRTRFRWIPLGALNVLEAAKTGRSPYLCRVHTAQVSIRGVETTVTLLAVDPSDESNLDGFLRSSGVTVAVLQQLNTTVAVLAPTNGR